MKSVKYTLKLPDFLIWVKSGMVYQRLGWIFISDSLPRCPMSCLLENLSNQNVLESKKLEIQDIGFWKGNSQFRELEKFLNREKGWRMGQGWAQPSRDGDKELLLSNFCYPVLGEEYYCFFNIRLGHVTCYGQRYMSGGDVCCLQAAVVRTNVDFSMFSCAWLWNHGSLCLVYLPCARSQVVQWTVLWPVPNRYVACGLLFSASEV